MKFGRAEWLRDGKTGRRILQLKPLNYNWNFRFLRGRL